MADRYWVGGAGNWSDTARWSTTSGGASGASVPGVGDNAIFDASSDSGSNFTATVDTAVTVDNLTFTSVDRLITLGTAGNLTVSTATTISASAGTNGMLVSGNASLGAVTLTSGTLNIDGNTVTMSTFTSTAANTRTFNYGTNGTVTLTGNNATIWNISTAGTSTISGTGTVDCTYSGGTGTRTITNSPDTGATNTNLKISAGTDTVTTLTQAIKSLDFTGFTGTFSGSDSFNIAGSLTAVAGMTYTHTGTLTFSNTGTITSAGKTLGPITINGSGITVTLGDALNIGTNTLTVTQGTFTTSASNYSITAGFLSSSNSNTRTISLNGSTVTLASISPIDFSTTTNLTFNAGTSQINITNAAPTLIGGGRTFYNVSFTNTAITTASITGANTFNDLTFAARDASGIGILNLSQDQTINGTFTVQSGATDPTRRLFIRSDTFNTTRTITAAAISIFGADFRDITAAGVASWDDSSSAGYWGDCRGNTNITFAAGKTVYWNLAGAQNWGATAWALTSNGTPSTANFPLAQDTAVFDNAGSVTGTITINLNWNIGSIDMSGRTSAMTLASGATTPFIYGSWTNGSGTTFSGTGLLTFAGRTTQTITSAGKTFSQPFTVDSPSGTVQLGDNFSSSNTITHTNGTFNANNYNLTCTQFASNNSNTRTITMGSGLWTLSGTGTVWNLGTTTNLTFNKDTANILLSNTSTTARTFAGGGLTYNKLTIGGATGTSTLTINGTNTFSELASTKTVAHIITFGADQTITTWSVTGSSGNLVTVNSDTAGTARTLTITNRTSGINWLSVQDITAPLAPVTFYAGANTRLFSNVLGVAARSPKNGDFIYVLASGTTWTVPADWNNANNEIHLFSGGGGGAGGRASGNNRAGGGGGGGAGYTKVTNLTLTPSSSVSYAIGSGGGAGAGGANGIAGGNTTFDSGTYTTVGGGGGQATTTPTSTGGTAGTGSTFNGGVGGVGSTSTVISTGNGGGGGAGAGGPLGAGANGGNGFASVSSSNIAGGGGGGNGGGSVGGNATSGTGGTGGNNSAGAGGGSGSVGFNGGGGSGNEGGDTQAYVSGSGIDITNVGMGGSGGSGGKSAATISTSYNGLFGGGGGGGRVSTGGTTSSASAGGQGGIIIWYNDGVTPSTDGDFLSLFR